MHRHATVAVGALLAAVLSACGIAAGREADPQETALRWHFVTKIREVTSHYDVKLRELTTSYNVEEQELKQAYEEAVALRKKLRKGAVGDIGKNHMKWEAAEACARLKAQRKVLRENYVRNHAGLTHRKQELLRRLSEQHAALLKRLKAGDTPSEADIGAAIRGALRMLKCPTCSGAGHVECPECKGNGEQKRKTTCPDCLGRGALYDRSHPVWRSATCKRCAGTGRISRMMTCLRCFGTGQVTCERCFGTGEMPAPKKHGEQGK